MKTQSVNECLSNHQKTQIRLNEEYIKHRRDSTKRLIINTFVTIFVAACAVKTIVDYRAVHKMLQEK